LKNYIPVHSRARSIYPTTNIQDNKPKLWYFFGKQKEIPYGKDRNLAYENSENSEREIYAVLDIRDKRLVAALLFFRKNQNHRAQLENLVRNFGIV